MLELYQAEGCPYCTQVRDKMTELGLSYVVHNPRLPIEDGGSIKNEQTQDQLTEIGEMDQIPFLVDHDRGEELYESDDINEYLEEYYN